MFLPVGYYQYNYCVRLSGMVALSSPTQFQSGASFRVGVKSHINGSGGRLSYLIQ